LSGTIVGFYSDVHNFQDSFPIGFGSFVMLNAERVHTAGLETELLARPVHGLELTCRIGYVSSRFDRFATGNGVNLDGNDVDFVPEYTVDISTAWRPGHGLFLQAGAQGIGAFALDEANTARQSAYWLLNLRAGWEGRHCGFAVFGRNLLETHYVANAIHLVTPQGSTFLAIPSDPLTFGVEVFARF
jgi:iron complex outermembrane receptor protein